MNNRDYWFKRAQQHDKEVYKSVAELEKELKKLYSEALDEIMKDFESYAQRYGMNYKSLWKAASKLDQKGFRKYVEENAEKLRMNSLASEEIVDKFFPDYDPAKVNRNALIYKQLTMRVAPLAYAFEENLSKLLENIYVSTLLKNKYDFAKDFNISSPFYKFDENKINEILTYKWSGENFSTRIWANTDDLRYVLQQEFVKATIKGESIPKLASTISKRMSTSYQDAIRLVNTEAAYFDNKASIDSYVDCKLDKYEYLSTLDSHTSTICKGLDGKVFNVKDAAPGVNYPPMHVKCRSTTIPYFEDNDLERIAKDSNDKNVIVDGSLTYEEWEKKYVRFVDDEDYIKSDEPDDYYKVYPPIKSNVNWMNHLSVSKEVSNLLNTVHSELNEFMNTERREKLYFINTVNDSIPLTLEGESINQVDLTKDAYKILKSSAENSIVFSHVHPSPTSFSMADIKLMIDYKSIQSYSLECANGDKYILDRGSFKNTLMKKLSFDGNYDKIKSKIEKNFPELNDPEKIYDVWDDFMFEVNKAIAEHYGMVFKKVE